MSKKLLPFSDVPLSVRVSDWTPADCYTYAVAMAKYSANLGQPVSDPLFEIEPHGEHPAAVFSRSCSVAFWNNAASKVLRRAQAFQRLEAGEVGKFAPYQYASSSCLEWFRHRVELSAEFVKRGVLFDHKTGTVLSLKGVMKTPETQAAAHYARIKGVAELAESQGLRWGMITVTLPPEWHPNPTQRARGIPWNKQDARAACDYFGKQWQRFTKALANARGSKRVPVTGFRVEEAMQDGTPHWHCLVYFEDMDQLHEMSRQLLRQFPGGLRVVEASAKPGATQLTRHVSHWTSLDHIDSGRKPYRGTKRAAQVRIDVGAQKTGDEQTDRLLATSSTYAFKYVLKFVTPGVEGGEEDLAAKAAREGNHAHRSVYGIRAITALGLPKGASGNWDLLRAVILQPPLDEDGLELFPRPGVHTAKLAEICQRERGAGYREFLELTGGLAISPVSPVYVITPLKADTYNGHGENVQRSEGFELLHVPTGVVERYTTRRGSFQIMGSQSAAESMGSGYIACDSLHVLTGGAGVKRGASPLGQLLLTCSTFEVDETGEAAKAANESQWKAINSPLSGHFVVLAAAGSGKTRVLVGRAKHLANSGISQESIVLTTFTRKAASNLRERLDSEGLQGVQVGTMHSLAATWSEGCEAQGFEEVLSHSIKSAKRTKHLLIDEAQDLNPLQWEWVRAHALTSFVVGDPRQSIFGFQGAAPNGLINWAHEVGASQADLFDRPTFLDVPFNRRSSSLIVELGNLVAANHVPARSLRGGGSISFAEFSGEEAERTEFAAVMQFLREAVGSRAVVVRTNRELTLIKSRLRLSGCPDLAEVPVFTVHESKGLEFDSVAFALGQRKRADESDDRSESYYVALTRARRNLFITSQGAMPPLMSSALSQLSESFDYDPVEDYSPELPPDLLPFI